MEEKKIDGAKLVEKYPDKVPILVKPDSRIKDPSLIIDKKKFLVPRDLQVAQFIFVIRKRLRLKPEQAIFLFFGDKAVNTSASISSSYEMYKNKEDQVLHVTYACEAAFG
jgi:GABA(A) receptor-associated protein